MKQSTIPTDLGNLTTDQIVNELSYNSYAANRYNGMTHEQLLSIGLGNDAMKQRYAKQFFVNLKTIFGEPTL